MLERVKIAWAVVCDYASLTVEGKVNVLGIFGEIKSGVIPVQIAQLFAVISYQVGADEYGTTHQARIVLGDATDDLATVEADLTVSKPPRSEAGGIINQLVGFGGVTFPRVGEYSVRVFVDGAEQVSVPILVHLVSEKEGV